MPIDHIIHDPTNVWTRHPAIIIDPDTDQDRVPEQSVVVSVDSGNTVCLRAANQELFMSPAHAYELGQFLTTVFKPKKKGRK